MAFKQIAPDQVSRNAKWIENDLARMAESTDSAGFCDYKAAALAGRYGITPRQLRRYFKKQFGISPKEWLHGRRMKIAGGLMRTGEPVKVVAVRLGFKQPSHFCSVFKRQYGVSPLVSRKVDPLKKPSGPRRKGKRRERTPRRPSILRGRRKASPLRVPGSKARDRR